MQKFLGVLLLGLLVCSNAFADEFKPVTKEDNVSLFGVVLGDNIKNYELTKLGCSVWAIRDVKECQIVPKIKNETYFLLIGNKAEVLELQGKEEAKKYWTEAKLFKSLFENS